jgi:DNA polymerase-3 subunit alpha
VLEALVRSGAADALGPNRATLWEHLPKALQGADQMHRDIAAGQVDLFGLEASADVSDSTSDVLVTVEEWEERERLRAEKDTLGLYLSGHPIYAHLEELGKITHGRLKALCAKAGGDSGMPSWKQRGVPVVAAGLIIGIRFRDIQGGKMGFATLDDQSGRVEVTMRGDLLEASGHLLHRDEVLVVDGDISTDDFNGGYKIRAKEIYTLETARSRFARRLVINLSANQLRTRGLDELIATLKTYSKGSTPVQFEYDNGEAKAKIQAGKGWRVHPKHELLDDLSKLTGEKNIELVY